MIPESVSMQNITFLVKYDMLYQHFYNLILLILRRIWASHFKSAILNSAGLTCE